MMLPDLSGLRQSINENTAVQRELLLMMQRVHAALQEQNSLLRQSVDITKQKQ